MSAGDTNQIFKVVGDLQIQGSSDYKETRGLISFTGPFGTKLGQLRSYGYGGFGNLLLDSSDLNGGLEFRTLKSQGSAFFLGGQEGQMPLAISGSTTTMKYANIEEKGTLENQGKLGDNTLLTVRKQNTTNASELNNYLAEYTLGTFKPGESTAIALGNSTYSGWSEWGYSSTVGSGSDVGNKSYIAMGRNGTAVKNVEFNTDGSVNIPTTITAGTVSATTYVGLPTQSVEPLTLDDTNDRVGINQVTPTEALDVTGNILASGTVTANTVSATTYVGLPTQSVEPLTLDDTNDRVGINQVAPTEALDIVGNVLASGTVTANTVSATTYVGLPTQSVEPLTLDDTNDRVGINQVAPTEALDIVGNVLASGTVTANTVSATTYVGLPTQSVEPLTLDDTNDRVGINKVTPTEALDVVGNIRSSAYVMGDAVTVGYNPSVKEGWAMYRDSSTLKLYISPVSTAGVPNPANDVNVDYTTGKVEANSIDVSGTVTANTVSATTYVGLPAVNVAPITLDTVNNRVGINQTVPTAALEVTGTILAQNQIRAIGQLFTNDTSIQSNNGNPEGVRTAPVGSLYLRKDGGAGTTLYTKESGTGNTGWKPFIPLGVPSLFGYTVTASLGSNTAVAASTTVNLFSFSLPYSGSWIVYCSLKTDGPQNFVCLSNVSLSFTESFPEIQQVIYNGFAGTTTWNSAIDYNVSSGTKYYVFRNSNTNIRTVAGSFTRIRAVYQGP